MVYLDALFFPFRVFVLNICIQGSQVGQRFGSGLVDLECLPPVRSLHLNRRVLQTVRHCLDRVIAIVASTRTCRLLGHTEHLLQSAKLRLSRRSRHRVHNRSPLIAGHLSCLSSLGCCHPFRSVREFLSTNVRHNISKSKVALKTATINPISSIQNYTHQISSLSNWCLCGFLCAGFGRDNLSHRTLDPANNPNSRPAPNNFIFLSLRLQCFCSMLELT